MKIERLEDGILLSDCDYRTHFFLTDSEIEELKAFFEEGCQHEFELIKSSEERDLYRCKLCKKEDLL